MTKKILIIEDDQEINKLFQALLTKHGLIHLSAYSGSEGILLLQQQTFDLVLLDLMIPGINGKEVLQFIRDNFTLPVIIISAMNGVDTKIDLLRSGADDYITKPFNQEEVIARIDVQLRKVPTSIKPHEKKWRNLSLDDNQRIAKLETTTLNLTNAEFDILSLLIDNPSRALSKKTIYEKVWHGTYYGDDNTISVHISNIRKKISVVTEEEYIKTVWGIGFMLI
ncbi:response regulator transcription factor [Enterococcus gallinarum]|uniref:response regulator transcription factor n=1 Tax=Enterococcus gallinarum TaxID=1353 RepID=UPI0018AC8C1C|nr:response regulator transcription factor [Enterococcus gallinarum]